MTEISNAYGIYVGEKDGSPDAEVGAVYISWADEFYGPQMKWYNGTEWLPINPDPVQESIYEDDDMKKIRVLKPKYAQSRYPTKSARRRTREQGLRDAKAKLTAQVENLEKEIAELTPEESNRRLPNPGSRKLLL